jgi:demethylmenaquinone methyltransferase/2-methoxy-6-polyprenyl-1,4-benzoquinol methylase
MRFFRTMRFLDVATGTADLAVEAARRHPPVRVAGLDFVREMMVVGRQKIQRHKMADRIGMIQGDALSLPFEDHRFDVAAIAFGIRNIPDRRRALREMKRVVVPGGQVMVLEMNFPRHPLFRRVYDLYLNRALPRMARLFSRNPAAYRYLGDSIKEFPQPDHFAHLMAETGLINIQKYALTLGITYLYIGLKPETAS